MTSEKLKIVSVGGGAPDGKAAPALSQAVEISGAEKPRVLIIPSAKYSQESHDKIIDSATKFYAGRLGLDVAVLHGYNDTPTSTQVEHEIGRADVTYIAGGDTDRMMKLWRRTKVAELLSKSALSGSLVLSGVSAGAIAPFAWGHSDSLMFREETKDSWKYIPVDGLGLVGAAITPHYNTSDERLGDRAESFRRMLSAIADHKATSTGFGIDNTAAIIVSGGQLAPFAGEDDYGVYVLQQDANFRPVRLAQDESIDLSSLSGRK